jgi:hypothetical protein
VNYDKVRLYVKLKYGLDADDQAKDLSRATFLCHDPEAYFNPKLFEWSKR